jgi:hypothetical protein
LVRSAHPTCNQIELSLLAQSSAWDGQLLAWSPLAGGAFIPALQQALAEVATTRQLR